MAKALLIQAQDPSGSWLDGLAADGYSCRHCRSLDEALDLCVEDAQLRVVVLDAHLPADELLDGLETLRELRPHLQFLGQGQAATTGMFRALGIPRRLDPDWTVADLLIVLREDPLHATDEARIEGLEQRIDSLHGQMAELVSSVREASRRRPAEVLLEELGAIAELADAELGFLRQNEIFGVLGEDALRVVAMLGQRVIYDRGAQVFAAGEPCDTLYVIKRGGIEIQRASEPGGKPGARAFLGGGEVLCEMGILPGTEHQSVAVALEETELLCFRREVFTGLLTMFPQLAVHMYAVMARRLEQAVQSGGGGRERKLQGCLEHFDLATILQSLILGEERTGVLSIRNAQGARVARIKLGAGRFRYAEMGAMRGRDAIYQLFQSDFDGHSFSFRERVEEDSAEMPVDEEMLSIPGTSLLLDAARLTDELDRIKQDLFQDAALIYEHGAEELAWVDELTQNAAEQIWVHTADGASLDQLLEQVEMSHAQIYCVLAEMLRLGIICSDDDTVGAQAASRGDSWLLD